MDNIFYKSKYPESKEVGGLLLFLLKKNQFVATQIPNLFTEIIKKKCEHGSILGWEVIPLVTVHSDKQSPGQEFDLLHCIGCCHKTLIKLSKI